MHSDSIGWRIQTSIKATSRIVTLAPVVSEKLNFEIFGIENLDKGQRVQHRQWSDSMANINDYKIHK